MFHKVLKYLTIGLVNLLLSAGDVSLTLCYHTICHPTSPDVICVKCILLFILSFIIVFVLRLIALPILYNIKNSYFYDYLMRFCNDKKYMFKILSISLFMDIVLILIQSFCYLSEYGSYWNEVTHVANITLFTGSSITAYLSFLIYIKIKMYYESKKKLTQIKGEKDVL